MVERSGADIGRNNSKRGGNECEEESEEEGEETNQLSAAPGGVDVILKYKYE